MIEAVSKAQVGLWALRDRLAARARTEDGAPDIVAVIIIIAVAVVVGFVIFGLINGATGRVGDKLDENVNNILGAGVLTP